MAAGGGVRTEIYGPDGEIPGDVAQAGRLGPRPGPSRREACVHQYGPCPPGCAHRRCRFWPPTPSAGPGTGLPAKGSPRTPHTPTPPAPSPTGHDRSRSRSGPRARPRRYRRRHARRPAHAAWPCRLRPRSAGPGPEPARPGPSARHRDDQRPSHHQPAELSSAYLPLALDYTGSLRENHQRPKEQCSRQPRPARHPSSDPSSGHRRAHSLPKRATERARASKCSPASGYQNPSLLEHD
jgi:hypothetical protein